MISTCILILAKTKSVPCPRSGRLHVPDRDAIQFSRLKSQLEKNPGGRKSEVVCGKQRFVLTRGRTTPYYVSAMTEQPLKELKERFLLHLAERRSMELYGSDRALTKLEVIDTVVDLIEGFNENDRPQDYKNREIR